jgi:dTDP-6-deoxy-L-talose 4-dehydrogenase (NAD+)
MREGQLREDEVPMPGNPYAQAKDRLRLYLEELAGQYSFRMRWVRLFYLFGKGQGANSLFSQLDRALQEGASVFNMSGGEQMRDFLPVGKAAAYLVSIALQSDVIGIINCCSGRPVKVRDLVKAYLAYTGRHIELNLGYYPYPDYEPMNFWGDDCKLRRIVGNDDNQLFAQL